MLGNPREISLSNGVKIKLICLCGYWQVKNLLHSFVRRRGGESVCVGLRGNQCKFVFPMKLVLLNKTNSIPSCVAKSESSAAKGLQQNGLDL